jgi:hypothetical protein
VSAELQQIQTAIAALESQRACERKAAPARELLDAMLAFAGAEQSLGLVKSRVVELFDRLNAGKG